MAPEQEQIIREIQAFLVADLLRWLPSFIMAAIFYLVWDQVKVAWRYWRGHH